MLLRFWDNGFATKNRPWKRSTQQMLPHNHSGRIRIVFDDPRHPGPGRLPHPNLPSLHASYRWIRAKVERFIGLNQRSR